MLAEDLTNDYKICNETLESFIKKDTNYSISHKARFSYFKHRFKIEFLKRFVV